MVARWGLSGTAMVNEGSSAPTLCPYCKSPLEPSEAVQCPGCQTLHHRACWADHKTCSVFGCKGRTLVPLKPGVRWTWELRTRTELLLYAVLVVSVYVLAVVPHILDYGWAFRWPGSGLGFPVALLGLLLTIAAGGAAIFLALLRPRTPRFALVLRLVAIPVILLGPFVVNGILGGLATSEGRGLVARVRQETPVDRLQDWAVKGLQASPRPTLPPDISATLPYPPSVVWDDDHVTLQWYNDGILIGPPGYVPSGEFWFREEIRPGVFVVIVEK
jgi:hypothetical protein